MLVEKWNDRVDQTSCSINGASGNPKVKNENFDFLWMLAWPSEVARDACYEEWLSNHEEGWQEDIKGIMSNDIDNGAFLFSQEVGRFPKSWRIPIHLVIPITCILMKAQTRILFMTIEQT